MKALVFTLVAGEQPSMIFGGGSMPIVRKNGLCALREPGNQCMERGLHTGPGAQGCDPEKMVNGKTCSWNQAASCFCDSGCIENNDCCADHKEVCAPAYGIATNVEQMAKVLGLSTEDWANYGCQGRGKFDAFSQIGGKAVDRHDRAFRQWRICVQCLSNGATSMTELSSYSYSYAKDECNDSAVCECDRNLLFHLRNEIPVHRDYKINNCVSTPKTFKVSSPLRPTNYPGRRFRCP